MPTELGSGLMPSSLSPCRTDVGVEACGSFAMALLLHAEAVGHLDCRWSHLLPSFMVTVVLMSHWCFRRCIELCPPS